MQTIKEQLSPLKDIDFLIGWRPPNEQISEEDKAQGRVTTELEEEYETYFDDDVRAALTAQVKGDKQTIKPVATSRVKKFFKKARYYVPIFMWLPNYDYKADIASDIVAGLATAALLIPQALAYSILAGLPPIIGLYTAWVPLLIYFIFGTSKQLSIGPDALGAILVGLVLEEKAALVGEGSFDPVATAHFLALLSGSFLFIMGIFRLGFLARILSRPLLCGFVNAVALFILFEQVDTLFGLPPAAPLGIHGWHKVEYLFKNTSKIQWWAFGVEMIGIAFLGFFRWLKKKKAGQWKYLKFVPEILILVIFGIVASAVLDLEHRIGLRVLGKLPNTFPIPKWPGFGGLKEFQESLPSAMIIAIIGFVESTVVGKTYATKHNYYISSNRELVALGLSNMVASFFKTFPTFASLPRSGVADNMGARSQIFALIASTIVLITIVLLGPVFYYLPKVIMSSIICIAAYGLFEFEDIHFLWHLRAWRDLIVLIVTFVTTLMISIELGITLGAGVSIILAIKATSNTYVSLLGKMPESDKYKDTHKFPTAQKIPGIVIVSVTDALHFANIERLKDMISRIERLGTHVIHPGEDRSKEEIRAIILKASGITSLDFSALQIFHELIDNYRKRGVLFLFVKLPDFIETMFTHVGILGKEDENTKSMFDTVDEAVKYAEMSTSKEFTEVQV